MAGKKVMDFFAGDDEEEVAAAPEVAEALPRVPSHATGGTKERVAAMVARPAGMVVSEVKVDAIVGGCLMSITFGEGTNPAEVKRYLQGLDAGVQVREEFPKSGGFGGYGSKDVKSGKALMVNVRVGKEPEQRFIEFTVQPESGDPEIVKVGSSKVSEVKSKVDSLGLNDTTADKFRIALDGGGIALFGEGEQFKVSYSKAKNGENYVESIGG
jgi:hypothetical protein